MNAIRSNQFESKTVASARREIISICAARQRVLHRRLHWLTVCLVLSVMFSSGCAALHPMKGIPARYLPTELRGEKRSNRRTIDLSLLAQNPPKHHLVDTGDVLAIWVEGVLGKRQESPPVFYPRNEEVAPSIGYPIPVREDGTISLPLIDPLLVRGKTLREVEDAIRHAVTVDKKILNAENAPKRIIVALQKPRTYRILVIRQEETAATTGAGGVNLGQAKRGSGFVVNLPVYENDVLHALAKTGGPPGLDAENTVYVIRRKKRDQNESSRQQQTRPRPPHSSVEPSRFNGMPNGYGAIQQMGYSPGQFQYASNSPRLTTGPLESLEENFGHSVETTSPIPRHGPGNRQPWPMTFDPNMVFDNSWSSADVLAKTGVNPQTMDKMDVLKIPIRLAPGESVNITEKDIILADGDIVFIESRDTDVFYTGGLLGGGQYTLPRDYDIDVIDAISIAQSALERVSVNRSGIHSDGSSCGIRPE